MDQNTTIIDKRQFQSFVVVTVIAAVVLYFLCFSLYPYVKNVREIEISKKRLLKSMQGECTNEAELLSELQELERTEKLRKTKNSISTVSADIDMYSLPKRNGKQGQPQPIDKPIPQSIENPTLIQSEIGMTSNIGLRNRYQQEGSTTDRAHLDARDLRAQQDMEYESVLLEEIEDSEIQIAMVQSLRKSYQSVVDRLIMLSEEPSESAENAVTLNFRIQGNVRLLLSTGNFGSMKKSLDKVLSKKRRFLVEDKIDTVLNYVEGFTLPASWLTEIPNSNELLEIKLPKIIEVSLMFPRKVLSHDTGVGTMSLGEFGINCSSTLVVVVE